MKYMGSKERISAEILPIILKDKKDYDLYIEPFCGSLAVIEKVTDIKRFASDKNPYLIAMWKGLRFGLDKPMDISRSLYNEYRNKYNTLKKCSQCQKDFSHTINFVGEDTIDQYRTPHSMMHNKITFRDLFLIGWIGYMASFNGRFYDGGYYGKSGNQNYVDEQIRNTMKQVPLLKDIDFHFRDFEGIHNMTLNMLLRGYGERFIFYCDIPYKGTKQYEYSKEFNYELFYMMCRYLSRDGHKIFVSEYQMPDDFTCVWEKEVTNSMNLTKTKKSVERLFTL